MDRLRSVDCTIGTRKVGRAVVAWRHTASRARLPARWLLCCCCDRWVNELIAHSYNTQVILRTTGTQATAAIGTRRCDTIDVVDARQSTRRHSCRGLRSLVGWQCSIHRCGPAATYEERRPCRCTRCIHRHIVPIYKASKRPIERPIEREREPRAMAYDWHRVPHLG